MDSGCTPFGYSNGYNCISGKTHTHTPKKKREIFFFLIQYIDPHVQLRWWGGGGSQLFELPRSTQLVKLSEPSLRVCLC